MEKSNWKPTDIITDSLIFEVANQVNHNRKGKIFAPHMISSKNIVDLTAWRMARIIDNFMEINLAFSTEEFINFVINKRPIYENWFIEIVTRTIPYIDFPECINVKVAPPEPIKIKRIRPPKPKVLKIAEETQPNENALNVLKLIDERNQTIPFSQADTQADTVDYLREARSGAMMEE